MDYGNYGLRHVIHILDDFLIVEHTKIDCLGSFATLLKMFMSLWVPTVTSKTMGPSQVLEFMGVVLDSNRMEACLPKDNLARIWQLLISFTNRRSACLVDLQSLSALCNSPAKAYCILRMTRVFHLMQIITEYTRITEHSRTLVDLFVPTRPKLCCSGVILVGFSNHCAVFGIRKLHRIKLPPPKTVKARNYKPYDPEIFRADLNRVPWDVIELESNPEDVWNFFKDLFVPVADNNAPVLIHRVRGRSLAWITPTIKDLMKRRDYHHKKAIHTNNKLHWSSYKRLRNAVTMKLRKEKASYYSKLLCEK